MWGGKGLRSPASAPAPSAASGSCGAAAAQREGHRRQHPGSPTPRDPPVLPAPPAFHLPHRTSAGSATPSAPGAREQQARSPRPPWYGGFWPLPGSHQTPALILLPCPVGYAFPACSNQILGLILLPAWWDTRSLPRSNQTPGLILLPCPGGYVLPAPVSPDPGADPAPCPVGYALPARV